MKKQSRRILFLWVLIAATATGGTFLIAEHLGTGAGQTTSPATNGGAATIAQPSVDVQPDVSASGTAVGAVAMQNFSDSNDGYAFSVPASWSIERTGTDTIALHPDAASPAAACKIEVSAFPYTPGTDMADWIAHRIGADPSIAVTEQSSEDVSVSGGTGVQWTGTIDGIPTTLVYAFNDQHAYEIAPSVIGENSDGAAQCSDMLETFLSTLTI
ncbi:MAG TPA: hypothetical protein VMR99_03265 [Candidatus Paceibacterota bacterium]|nr:hypothetical protein [Candidatus Paceibacterota bacterium]